MDRFDKIYRRRADLSGGQLTIAVCVVLCFHFVSNVTDMFLTIFIFFENKVIFCFIQICTMIQITLMMHLNVFHLLKKGRKKNNMNNLQL